MSYYDDASLMFLAGGGAQKDGTAYSVKPVPVYGTERVTNGDFATDSDWTKQTGWTISGGKAIVTNAPNLYQRLTQSSLSFNLNSTYKISITCSEYSSGFVYLRKPRGAEPDTNLRIDSVGTFVFTLNALTELNEFALAIGALGTDLKIDNISVKEVLVGDGDFTFSRGSNLAATRVDAAYLIEKGRENLALYSNTFSNWTNYLTAETGGQLDRSGGNTAWLLEKTGGGGSIYRTHSTSGVATFSVYLKSGTLNWVRLDYTGGGSKGYFDLQNGVVGSVVGSPIDTAIEDAGNGWYRCSVTTTSTGSGVGIIPAESDGSVGGTSGNILIQDAQLEVGLAATEYIESGATRGTAGILEDTPRFDYSNGASCPSLLLEPSRTNLLPSEYFGAVYTLSGTAIINNNTTSPEGLQNATKIYPTASGNYKHIRYSSLNPSTGVHTFSIFAKAGELDHLVLIDSDGGGVGVDFDLSTGVASDSASVAFDFVDMVDYGNGWYRCVATATNPRFVWILSDNGGVSVTANGTDGLYIYGAQAEANASYVSSYIPNHSGGTITRAADVCGGAGDANTFNDSEGVLYVESSALANDGTRRMISLSDTSTNNHIRIYPTTTDNNITIAIKSGNVNQYVYHYNGLSNITDTWKVAVKYKANDFATFVNGTKVNSSTSGSTPIGLNSLYFNSGSGGNPFYGKTKQVLVFNTALSDADLAALTTI